MNLLKALALVASLFVAAEGGAAAQTESQPVEDSALRTMSSAMGRSPQWVYDHFGRPARVSQEDCCVFQGYKSSQRHGNVVLVQAYDLVVGGRIAFVFDQPINGTRWAVVGFVYDALKSTQYETMSVFFPKGITRTNRVFACLDDDFYHAPEGEVKTQSVYGLWNLPQGRMLYVKYVVTGALQTRYDAVTGRDVPMIPSMNDAPNMVQLGYFYAPRAVMDMHFAQDDDFSIISRYKDCTK